MRFSTEAFDREADALHAFAGRELGDLTPSEFAQLREIAGRAKRGFDTSLAAIGAEVSRRSDPSLGSDGLAKSEGFTSPGRLWARDLGTSPQEANRLAGAGDVVRRAEEQKRREEEQRQREAAGQGGPSEPEAPDGELPLGVPGSDAGTPPDDPADRVYPILAAAIAACEIGTEAAMVVRRTLDELITADLRFEAQLVDKARTLQLGELRRSAAQLAALRNPGDLAEREKRQVDARTLYFTTGSDGMTQMYAKLDPATAAPIKTWIDAQVRAVYRSAREGMPEERLPGQIRADVLAGLAWHGLDCERPTSGVKTKVVLRADLKDLEAGVGVGECDALDQPISIETLRTMAVDAAVVPVTFGGESLPLDVGRKHRLFTEAQRTALAERDGGCACCHAPASHCEAHHIRWWMRDSGPTDISNGVLLCTGCHHRVHHGGWDVEVRGDKVWMIPPASVDPTRTPRLGGRAALEIEGAAELAVDVDTGPPRELCPSA
ncbi:HNH endonuclease signature motif containing protein [Demequina sp. NBRC 110055]|uniref:HNH endonuclease n=1 Tax=Demequina sp. NBRC 110055 TaxID=1570344 RepID=UPI0009FBF48B|nr:HNH endonuclease signature motif containing protein [Demequina sp. NBRC 110055]